MNCSVQFPMLHHLQWLYHTQTWISTNICGDMVCGGHTNIEYVVPMYLYLIPEALYLDVSTVCDDPQTGV